MNNKYQISFIVCLYNSETDKVLKTINSIKGQRDLVYEIIVCDDGSKCIDSDIIRNYLFEANIDHKIILNKENRGTIRNLLSGVSQSEGDYIFCLGPGDMIYDCFTGKNFYTFAMENNAKISFGKAVPYEEVEHSLIVHTEMYNSPKFPQKYATSVDISKKLKYCGLYFPINGTTFLREREIFMKLLEEVSQCIRYKEDYSSTILALVKGIDIVFYDCNTTWYEYNSGVSTAKNSTFRDVLYDEDKLILEYILKKYGNRRIISFCRDTSVMIKYLPKKKEVLKCFLMHPNNFLKRVYYSRLKKNGETVMIKESDKIRLIQLLAFSFPYDK